MQSRYWWSRMNLGHSFWSFKSRGWSCSQFSIYGYVRSNVWIKMNKNLLFVTVLIIPLALIGVGIYTYDIEHIERAFYLLLSFYGAYVASSFKEFRNIKISPKAKRNIIIAFVIAIFSIVISFFLDYVYLGCLIASIIGIYPFCVISRNKAN